MISSKACLCSRSRRRSSSAMWRFQAGKAAARSPADMASRAAGPGPKGRSGRTDAAAGLGRPRGSHGRAHLSAAGRGHPPPAPFRPRPVSPGASRPARRPPITSPPSCPASACVAPAARGPRCPWAPPPRVAPSRRGRERVLGEGRSGGRKRREGPRQAAMLGVAMR